MVKQKREKRVVGWKEHAALPDLNVKSVIAKIDTGATLASIANGLHNAYWKKSIR